MSRTFLRNLAFNSKWCNFTEIGIEYYMNYNHKHYLKFILFILFLGCASNTAFLPEGVTLEKNQMVYRDDPMGIWTHDWEGRYHHYAPADSAQYFTLTHKFGIQLENAFVGHCNRHNIVEAVNISPETITVMNITNRNENLLAQINKNFDMLTPTSTDYQSMHINAVQPAATDALIQAEKKGDTKK